MKPKQIEFIVTLEQTDVITDSENKRVTVNIESKGARPLIRCKDCVYFTPEKSGEHWNICRFYDAPKTADGYCNDAEPKENENGK